MTFYCRLLRLIVWLAEQCIPIPPEPPDPPKPKGTFKFTTVRIGGIVIKGDITHMKYEFGQNIDVSCAPEGGNYEKGTENIQLAAVDKDGNDVSGQFTRKDDPNDPLHVVFEREAGNTTECSGVISIRADGDEDADEEAPLVGSASFDYDSPNATGFTVTLGVAAPADGGESGGGDTGGGEVTPV